ncbi:chromate efflux transporter [Microbacterium sp. RD1]|uniref:chromate efflux transporter n=1 Tax=Microbacterium sp. RD1 TaxID=3457313 RepID=UPI003FA52F87
MRGSAGEVLVVFAKLGVTSFGGPIAHLGYFRDEIVTRRRWLSEEHYADLVALGQFLPGPASSQVGFAIGMLRAGAAGALAAFVAFTLPSAALMVALAAGADLLDGPGASGIVHGLTIVAVAIVAQAVWGMARTLTPDARRATIALGAAVLALGVGGTAGQVLAIALGAAAGALVCRGVPPSAASSTLRFPVSPAAGIAALALFAAVLVVPPVLTAVTSHGAVALFEAFSRAGALVFGGGHVVLPLLEAAVVGPGWVSPPEFLTGYAAVQAVPGPLFTFAAYLGALADVGPGGVVGALIATLAVFLPGFLLLVGVMPFWNRMRGHRWAEPLLRGANAAVVGILAAALYTPVFTTAVTGVPSFCLALVCFVLLTAWRLPPWVVVLVGAAGGAAIALLPI